MDDEFLPKNPKNFHCINCDYNTLSRKDYERHLSTRKHSRMTRELRKDDIFAQLDNFFCVCGKKYKYRQGLWKHKKMCSGEKSLNGFQSEQNIDIAKHSQDNDNVKVLTELVKDVIQQNHDLTNKLVHICKNKKTKSVSNNMVNSNNKTFNLQFFLNETCKDAMNISDFVDSIKLQISDLERVGEKGFVAGISDVVIDNLEDLDTRQRPIHCSDQKREIFYIKENNKWVKDEESNSKISTVIKQIANKNIRNISEWVKQNPGCFDSQSKYNDKYLQIVSNSMSGGTELEQKTNINKIISNVAKEVTINKCKY